ncbi:MAG: hypothetical protein GY806_12695 [Gammaproteobacteria bacterium]|nr:hypothetical protein [Gammaproteobacteria bacterium]
MKCPNCSSLMYVFDQNAGNRSLVKFYRCSNCIGEHVSSELLNQIRPDEDATDLFASNSPLQPKQVLQV